MHKYRRLLITGLNKLLEQKCLSLEYGTATALSSDNGYLESSIDGLPSMILWRDVCYGEIKISVWWDFNKNNHPQINSVGDTKETFRHDKPFAIHESYKDFVGVVLSGYLERKSGKYLMGKNAEGIERTYIRNDMHQKLKRLSVPTTLNFKPEGKFII